MILVSWLRAVLAVFLVGWGAVLGAHAQGSADPARLAAARDLLAASKVDQDLAGMLPALFDQMAKVMTPFFATDLTDDAQKKVFQERTDAIIVAVKQRFLDRRTELLDAVARFYADAFTAEELNAQAAFHSSPVGEKLRGVELALQSQLVQLVSDVALGKPLRQPEGVDPEALTVAREMFIASKFDETLNALFTSAAPRGERGKALAETLRARRAEMSEVAAAAYAKAFTVEELRQITAFYVSPHGAKLVSVQTKLLQDTAKATDDFAQKFAEELSQKIAEELKKIEK